MLNPKFISFQTDDDLVVTLKQPNSKIRGHILKSNDGNDFYAFQDIPYALPPIGKLRYLVGTQLKSIINTFLNIKKGKMRNLCRLE